MFIKKQMTVSSSKFVADMHSTGSIADVNILNPNVYFHYTKTKVEINRDFIVLSCLYLVIITVLKITAIQRQ